MVYERGFQPTSQLESTLGALSARLHVVAMELIGSYQDMSLPDNVRFHANPDGAHEHEPRWHQFGIVTHLRRAVDSYQQEVPSYVDEWQVGDAVREYLEKSVDGMPKAELLSLGLLLHDLGKFAVRQSAIKDGQTAFTFTGHEVASGAIVRGNPVAQLLRDHDISAPQTEYVARCGELHYELGKLRQVAANGPLKFSMAFAESHAMKVAAQAIIDFCPDYAVEIGVLYLADNLSKTDIRIAAETDGAIVAQHEHTRSLLQERGLPGQLIGAVEQLPVNVALARNYLALAVGQQSMPVT